MNLRNSFIRFKQFIISRFIDTEKIIKGITLNSIDFISKKLTVTKMQTVLSSVNKLKYFNNNKTNNNEVTMINTLLDKTFTDKLHMKSVTVCSLQFAIY